MRPPRTATRRERLCGTAVAGAVAALGCAPAEQAAGAIQEPADPAAPRPNVVLLMADDMGWGDPGYAGNPVLRTPSLDAMAASGMRFDRFYAASPSCSPTRGSCLTGRHPRRYRILGANHGFLPREEQTVAELLAAEGFATAHVGKWHVGTLATTGRDSVRGGAGGAAWYSPPWENGFQFCMSTEAEVPTWDPMIKPAGEYRITWDPIDDASEAVPFGTAFWSGERERAAGEFTGDDSRVLMDAALGFVESCAEREQPFLLVLWFHAPHTPLVSGPPFSDAYAEFENPLQRHYYGSAAAMDAQIGRLRERLRTLGLAEDTLVWFCSDNGPAVNPDAAGSTGGLRGRKSSLFEGGVRVPAVAEWPGRIPAGTRTDVLASTCDLLPTVLDAAGLELPTDRPIDGVSLLPVLEGADPPRGRHIGFEFAGQAALVEDRFKLVVIPEELKVGKDRLPPQAEAGTYLFDLVADPAESTDLAEQHPGKVRSMIEDLQRWSDSCRRSARGEDYGAEDSGAR